MNVVDSSGWLEYFADAKNAAFFSKAIEDVAHLIVQTISLTEVFKRVLTQRGEEAAYHAIALMQEGNVVPLDSFIAIHAAKLGVRLGLPVADSIILATAHAFDATLWTQDSDFAGVEGVRYIAK
jgi:predicted nucleic acid-binding protein